MTRNAAPEARRSVVVAHRHDARDTGTPAAAAAVKQRGLEPEARGRQPPRSRSLRTTNRWAEPSGPRAEKLQVSCDAPPGNRVSASITTGLPERPADGGAQTLGQVRLVHPRTLTTDPWPRR